MIRCPSCDREAYAEDAFCSQCGTRLQARSADTGLVRRTILKETTATVDRLACGSCHGPLLAGEVFCATCGARFGPATSVPGQREVRAEILRKLEAATRGRFEFVREIGRGGMGAVYLARELELERDVAIKVLSSSWLLDGSMVERFRREAKTIASLRHPSIVHVHGVGRADDIHYFVMDFIDGVSLGKILLTHGPLSIPATLAILGQVGSALHYAHRPGRSVIHRDIKPGNIMVDGEGGSYVTDFGISKATETHSGLTMTGLIMGTPEYMSPEQCRGDAAGPASDQYALGAVAFAMLTGSPPFTGPHYRVLVGHTSETPPAILDLRPDCPPEIAGAVERMLAKVPNERWPGIADAMSALGARPTLPDDPVRDELAELVRSARRSRRSDTGPTPEVAQQPDAGRTPTWLRILEVPASIEAGDAIDLRALKGFPDGSEIENGDIMWESTDPAIARIDPDTGRLVAVGAGSAEIRASVAGVSESVSIRVEPPRVTQLVLSPDSLKLEVGETRAFEAEPRGRASQSLDRSVLWSSSDPGIASVDGDGGVSAHREGDANVLAHCEGTGASAPVTVVPAAVAAVRFVDPPADLHVGTSTKVSAEARDARDALLDRSIAFSTSDASVVTASADGRIQAVAVGSARISATCEGRKATIDVAITPPPAASIETSPPPSELLEGDTFHLLATPLDADGQPVDVTVEWDVGDPGIIDSLGDGRFRALSKGSTAVTVRAAAIDTRVDLEVDALRAVSLALQTAPPSIQVDEVVELAVEMRDQRGRPLEKDVRWTTSDPWVARVSPHGVLEGAGPGNVTVTAECDGLSDSVEIEVTASPWATVVFKPEPSAEDAAESGDTGGAPATAEPAEAEPRQPPPAAASVARAEERRRGGLIWIAPVAIAGLAAAAWFGLRGGGEEPPTPPIDLAVPANVVIVDADGAALPAPLEIAVGDTVRLFARVLASDGSTLQGQTAAWTSEDPSLAAVDAAGVLSALADGTVRVVAAAGGITQSIDLTISPAARPTETTVAAEPPPTGRQSAQTQPAESQTTNPPATDPDPPVTDPDPPPPTQQQPPPEGVLQLIVLPWADIWVDDEQRGTQRRQLQLSLPPGSHQLRLENPNMVTVDTTLTIVSGQTNTVRITLTPRGTP